MATTVNGESASQKFQYPEVVLDIILADLLEEEPEWEVSEALCNIKLCAHPRHKTVPLNKKYLNTSTQSTDSDDLAHLQLENVNYLLSFWAGRMEVPMLACEGWTKDDTLTRESIEENAIKAFSVLNEKTFSNKDHFIQNYGKKRTQVRWGFAVDFAENVPCFVHPEKQYFLNSKRWLAECSLRSANDQIIDPIGYCSTHVNEAGLWYFQPDCNICAVAVDKEIASLKSELETVEPPFVLKLTQSLGSVGTWLVKDEKDRSKTVDHIIEIQDEALHRLTLDNAHIYPTTLILSDFLPGDTNALNFYIRRNGSVKFLGACQQLSTRMAGGGRQHTVLTWDRQDAMEQKFTHTLTDIGKVLHDQGYFGPCGADIMEAEDGTQYVIDLNVRTATSLVLGCLKGHCKQRSFNACGVYECLLLNLSREKLEHEFHREFQQGRFLLLGTTRLGRKDIWAYPVVIAGEDLDSLKDLSERILQFEAVTGNNAQDAGGA